MWVTEWGTAPGPDPRSADGPSALDIRSVELAKAFVWAEHCIECAIPDCYAVCPLYVARRDKKCARFKYGIYANPKFAGLLDRGADVHFRRWGRLEAPIAAGAASPRRLRQLAKLDRAAVSAVNRVAAALESIDPKRRLNGVYRILANEGLARSTRRSSNGASRFDDFVVEVFNPNLESVNLIVEVQHDRPVFRTSFLLEPGANLHRIPVAEMNGALDSGVGRLLVYPENDAEVRLIFRWLDLVRYTPAMRARLGAGSTGGIAIAAPSADRPTAPPTTDRSVAPAAPTSPVEPAAKVKCVAWDLDNTVWSGVLVEDGPAALTVRPGVVELIRKLDERGILNTIVSKNDHDPAWAKVTELELAEYFVSPAINWGPKSASLRAVAEVLNINLDTFVLIDDQAFERAEVASELPQVRVVADTEIDALLDRPEFDVPISAESRKRRLSYQAEEQRRAIAAASGGNYEEFLRSCQMRLELFHPATVEERERVLELLQRSNQLNLSTRRYAVDELMALLNDPSILSLGFRCSDRFGDYGIVGFLSVSMAEPVPVVRDLVISCRVAKKKVENAIFQWLATQIGSRGVHRLEAGYVRSARNHVLLDALTEVGFVATDERDGAQTTLALDVGHQVEGSGIVEVAAPGVEIPSIGASSAEQGASTVPAR